MNSMSIGRGSGHTAFPTTIDIIRNWGITIALGYILAFTFTWDLLEYGWPHALSNIICGVAFAL
jgi:Na+-driven multidrug efflux pump